jgi:hypothetical protein
MRFSVKKSYLLPASVISVIVLLLLLNLLIKPNLIIKTFCEVLPKEKWILTRGNDGQIISSIIDYSRGHTVQYSLNQFERGEYISLEFLVDDQREKFINRGDTIISMSSSDIEDRLLTVEGEFETAVANLKMQRTGQKESLIKEAEARLNYTDKKINDQKILFNRVESLYEKKLSSLQEYETQKWILDLLEIEREIYNAQLENLSTGVKREEIDLIESQIRSVESRLELLKRRKDKLEIISPISGYLANVYSHDTLLILINDKEIILHTPVKLEDIELLKNSKNVKLNLDDIEKEFSGSVISVSREVKFMNEQQVIFISIKIDNKDGELLPGMIKGSFLRIKEISLFEYLSRFLNT